MEGKTPEYTIIVESYTLDEGGAWDRFRRSLGAAVSMAREDNDFGFMYPCEFRDLHCYAFNNCGFDRETLLAVPAGGRHLRCACYFHAQQFLRRGTPMKLIPEAGVLHEMQPLIRERTRQGFDTIAACWEDPEVQQAQLLKLGILSIPLFYLLNVSLDWWKIRIDNPKLLVASRIVVRIGSELSEDALRKIFVNQATVGSASEFEGLWKSRLPGIPLKPLHSQPREIPYDGDRLCLELDQKSEHWASLLEAPGFVIGVSGVLPSEPQVDCYSVNR